MALSITVSFHDMAHSDSLEAYVRKRASKLERFSQRITGCHVKIEMPHRHHHTGNPIRVSIDLMVPGGEIVVNRTRDDDHNNHDAYAAIDQAVDHACRRLQEYVQVQRGDVKRTSSESE
jgi:ribosomal subunit interface protein